MPASSSSLFILGVGFCFLLLQVLVNADKMPRNECTIIKNPNPIPPVGVVSANPDRISLIARKYFDYFYIHTDFRGYQVYVGQYKGVPLFAAYIGLGSASAAFMMEELVAYDAKVVVRLGTNDFNMTESDINKVFVVRQCVGLVGTMRDYGYDQKDWGKPLSSDSDLVANLLATGKDPQFSNIQVQDAIGYNIDAFYAFFDPAVVSRNASNIHQMNEHYQSYYGASVRDMETCSVLLMGEMRKGYVRTASVLQAVVKHGSSHEDTGTTGVLLVLETLKKEAQKFPKDHMNFWLNYKNSRRIVNDRH